MTYSLDFRKKVLAVKERENLSFEQVASNSHFGDNRVKSRYLNDHTTPE